MGDRHPRWRRILAIVLAVVAIIAIVLSLVVTWEKEVLGNEDQFVSTLEDVPSNDAVATLLSIRVADRIVERSRVINFVVDALPEPLEFLATPLTVTIRNTISETAYGVITSDGFTEVWVATLRITHRSVSAILSGNDAAVTSEGGTVSMDLDAIAELAVARLESRGITLPDLDIEFGELVLYESEQLAAAQTVVGAMDTAGRLVPLVALILIGAALWAAPDRRRMTSFLGFGSALAFLIFLALIRIAENATVGGIEDEIARPAALAIWDAAKELLVQTAWVLLAVSLVIGFVAWVNGPSRHARSLSAWTKESIERWRQPEGSDPSVVGELFDRWKRAIEIGVVVVAALFVMFGPVPTGLSVLATAVVAGLVIGAVEMVAGPSRKADSALDVEA